MTEFLSWLFAAAYSVYLWFGSQFGSYLTVILSAWTWIVNKSHEAYLMAIDWAWARIREAQQDINGLFDWVIYQFDNLRSGVLQDLTTLYDWVVYQIEHIPQPDFSWLDQRINDLIDWINSIPENLMNWIYERVTEVQNWVWDNFGWVQDAYNYLTNLFESIPFDLFERVNNFFTDQYPTIIEFLTNPVGFILDLLWPYFVSALCFMLAHALGTTQDELPLTPPWKE